MIISMFYTAALNKEYKNLKTSYSKDVNEDYLLELDSIQKNLKTKVAELQYTTETLKQKEEFIEKRKIDYEQEIIKKDREIKPGTYLNGHSGLARSIYDYYKKSKYKREIGRASCREECRSRWSPYH